MVSWPIVTVQGKSPIVANRWRTRANALSLLRLACAPAARGRDRRRHAGIATAAVRVRRRDRLRGRRGGAPLRRSVGARRSARPHDRRDVLHARARRARPAVLCRGCCRRSSRLRSRSTCSIRGSCGPAAAREPARALERHRVLRPVACRSCATRSAGRGPARASSTVARARCRFDGDLDADRAVALLRARQACAEQLAIRAAQEQQPDRRVEEDEEVVHARARRPPSRRDAPGNSVTHSVIATARIGPGVAAPKKISGSTPSISRKLDSMPKSAECVRVDEGGGEQRR